LGTKVVHSNPWFKVNENKVIRPDGEKGEYFVVETKGPSVFIVPITNKDEVYLIGQYRYTTNAFSWEIPGGNSDGEEILNAAKRELKEETGLEAKKWVKIGTFNVMNGTSNEICNAFLALDLVGDSLPKQLDEGILEIKKVPLIQIPSLISSGEINDTQSITALVKALIYLKNI